MGVSDKSVVSITTAATSSRLKREDCKRTKHDSAFSEWKILIGPSDWEDYLLKKDNAQKYMTHNIPNCSSCSGVYELGIAVSLPESGRRGRNLSSKRIIPVYVGHADNIRTRLQQYGREGAHLEKGCPNVELNDSKAKGLFKEIFSKGFAVVFRWAPMKSKSDAEKTEARLLDTFDYAWNKERNGARRPNDIHQKLERHASRPTQLLPIVSKLHMFHPKKVGIRIRNCEPLLLENRSSFYMKQEGGDILSRIFKFGRSRPIVVSKEFGVNKDHTSICGVALGQGSVCTRKPVEERKRCTDHKGMKVNGSKPKLIAKQCRPEGFSPTCGVALDDGSFCTREPVTRRKRCEEHKGRRINEFISSPVIVEDEHFVHGPVLKSRTPCESGIKTNIDTIYGVDLKNRSFCTRHPVLRHERCEEHKGTRLDEHKSKIRGNSINGGSSLTCGAATLNGSPCQRKPGNGRKWCWQHVPPYRRGLIAVHLLSQIVNPV